jgi:hypothetical protein
MKQTRTECSVFLMIIRLLHAVAAALRALVLNVGYVYSRGY